MRTARWNEARVYLASHPLAFLLVELLGLRGGVVRIPGLGVVVSGATAAREILEDEEHFSKSGPGSAGVFYEQVMGGRVLMDMDGEEHRALRRRIGDLFSPTYLRVIAADVIAPPVSALTASLRAGRTVDLVPFVHELTGRMMFHQLGLNAPAREESAYHEMWALGEKLIAPLGLRTRRLTATQAAHARAAYERLIAPVRATYAAAGTDNSVVSRLRAAGLAVEEVEGIMAALFLVGTQTVSTALPRLVAILADTHELESLRGQRERLQGAIDEGLRLIVPSPVMLRSVRAATTVRGRRYRAGERVVILTYNLAKDHTVFVDPRRFDATREHPPVGRNIWFGVGQHFCLGFALAHLEIGSVLEALLELGGRLQIVERRPARHVLIPAYERLCVRVTNAA
jgi:cytochrome P450